jgi:predicted nuclease of predicted toxin-antitoxin system
VEGGTANQSSLSVIKFLIDECLSVALTHRARDRGHFAEHVTYIGLGGYSDRTLMPIIQRDDFLFVTNNRLDFLKLHGALDVHNGLIIIVPNVSRHQQIALFDRALDRIETLPDLINQVLEIEADGSIRVAFLSKPPMAGEP